MTELFSATAGGWTAVVCRAEPVNREAGDTNLLGEPMPESTGLSVQYRLGDEAVFEDAYWSDTVDADNPQKTHLTPETVERFAAQFLGLSLPPPELKTFELLQQTTQALCLHLLQEGGSVSRWCQGLGIKPAPKTEGLASRVDGSVLIDSPEGTFVTTPQEVASAAERRKPRKR